MQSGSDYRWGLFVAVFLAAALMAPFFTSAAPYMDDATGELDVDDLGGLVGGEGLLYVTAEADHYTQGYCQVLPCNFPEGDANEPRDTSQVGGFLFGTDLMTGHDEYAENFYYPHGSDHDGFHWETSSGYDDTTAEVGMDRVVAHNPLFYRGGIEGSDGNTYNMKMEARSARISHNDNDCSDSQYTHDGDDDDGYWGGASMDDHYSQCDVYMMTPEIAFRYVSATTYGILFDMERYWVVSPEDDWCRTSLNQHCLASAGDNNADAQMTRGFIRGYWFLLNDEATLNDAVFRIDQGEEEFPLEWNCDDRASDHTHNRNDLPGCY